MKLTNKRAYDLLQYMGGLHETGKLGFYIAKNMRLLKTELTEYIDIRNRTIDKYGEPENGVYRIPSKNVSLFLDSMKPYDDIECSFTPVQVDRELFISGTLESNDMFNLDWMVKDD